MKKRIASLTLALALIFSLSVSAFAATPRWGDTATCDAYLSFSGSTANCTVTVIGNTGTSKIYVTTALQIKNSAGLYTTVESWTETVYKENYSLYKTVKNCDPGSYRLIVSATVTNSSGSSSPAGESVTATL